MKYEVIPSKVTQGHWYVDRTRNGQTELIAIFLTVDAETQAREYARFMEEKSTDSRDTPVQSAPVEPPSESAEWLADCNDVREGRMSFKTFADKWMPYLEKPYEAIPGLTVKDIRRFVRECQGIE